MSKKLHIAITIIVLLLSQLSYYYAFKSNEITLDCDVVVKRCDNPYYGYFDIFKSAIQLVCAAAWTLIAFKVIKSSVALGFAFFWVFSVWNEFADYLWHEAYIFKLDEPINLAIGLAVSITLSVVWRKKLSPH